MEGTRADRCRWNRHYTRHNHICRRQGLRVRLHSDSLSDLYLVEGLKRSQTKLGPARSCFRQPGDSSFDVLLIRSLNVGLGAHREIAWLNAARTRKYRGRGNFRHPKQLGDAGTVAYATQCAP